MRAGFVCLVLLGSAVAARAQNAPEDGGALYARHCARCHDLGLPRTPSPHVLNGLAPDRILAALETGTMRTQGAERTPEQRRGIAAFLTGKAVGDAPAPTPLRMCPPTAPISMNAPKWNGWGVTPANVGSPPILVTLPSGKRALVIGQKSAVVHAIDPDDGGRVVFGARRSAAAARSAAWNGALPRTATISMRRCRTSRSSCAASMSGA